MTGRIIETLDDIAEGCAALAVACPHMARAQASCGMPPLRRHAGGFAALLRAVCAQQLSVAAAGAVWGRLEAAGAGTPAGLDRLSDAELRACGLSRPKIGYARALAAARLDPAALAALPEAEAVAALTAIRGVGRWTAEIYLMFAVGRADVLAAGDLALQEGARLLIGLPARPAERELRALAEPWAPWRAVAARLLWAYYAQVKSRDGTLEERAP